MHEEFKVARYGSLSWRHVLASVVMLAILAIGSVIAKAVTPELPSTIITIALLVGVLAYFAILMKGRPFFRKKMWRLCAISAAFAVLLIMGDPNIMNLKAAAGTVLCGDTGKNLCNMSHLKYLVLFAWI